MVLKSTINSSIEFDSSHTYHYYTLSQRSTHTHTNIKNIKLVPDYNIGHQQTASCTQKHFLTQSINQCTGTRQPGRIGRRRTSSIFLSSFVLDSESEYGLQVGLAWFGFRPRAASRVTGGGVGGRHTDGRAEQSGKEGSLLLLGR